MSAPSDPPRARGPSPHSRTGRDLRASDAERAEVADRLSKHYADGRLDEAEFNERVDRAMNAKTQSDFIGLFADLPGIDMSEPPARRGRRYRRMLFLVLVILVAVFVVQELVRSFVPWLLIGLLGFMWLHHRAWNHRRL